MRDKQMISGLMQGTAAGQLDKISQLLKTHGDPLPFHNDRNDESIMPRLAKGVK